MKAQPEPRICEQQLLQLLQLQDFRQVDQFGNGILNDLNGCSERVHMVRHKVKLAGKSPQPASTAIKPKDTDNVADMFTKPMRDPNAFHKLRRIIMNEPESS